MTRKVTSILFLILMLMFVVFGTAIAEEHTAHLTVVATTYPLYDMAIQIGGDCLNVVYQPEANAESIGDANILLCMGGERDSWITDLEGISIIQAMNGIELIEGEESVLTIPINTIITASYFVDTIKDADKAHKDVFANNLNVYCEAFIALDLSFRGAIQKGTKVFCEDGSMAYFAKEYSIEVSDTADGAVILNTYEYPAEEDLTVSYLELMKRNLETLSPVE